MLRAINKNLQKLKSLKVALIGAPNAGKSTLLNKLVDQNISCVSSKVHTTRQNILGVLTNENTQIEFIDSPGLTLRKHCAKHSLEHTFLTDPKAAVSSCDLVTVLIDIANVREKKSLNKGIINLLESYPTKHSILVLNKVDLVKDKRSLLDSIAHLTGANYDEKSMYQSQQGQQTPQKDYIVYLDEKKQEETQEKICTWSNFSRVFLTSALKNDGVEEIKDYLFEAAHPTNNWNYGSDFVTDLSAQTLTTSIVRGKYLDCLPKEVPYLLDYKYGRWGYDDYGTLHATLNIICPKAHLLTMIIGPNGTTIGRITRETRIEMSKLFNCETALKLVAKPVNAVSN